MTHWLSNRNYRFHICTVTNDFIILIFKWGKKNLACHPLYLQTFTNVSSYHFKKYIYFQKCKDHLGTVFILQMLVYRPVCPLIHRAI
jgi:hypothetical protein